MHRNVQRVPGSKPQARVRPHPLQEQERVCDLAHASWIDEYRSRPGNDLGTWIGEPEENAAWDLLREMRELFQHEKITPQIRPQAFEALYATEGRAAYHRSCTGIALMKIPAT